MKLSCVIKFGMILVAFWCVWLAAPKEASAGGDPINLFLVVNSESASSKLIANNYIFHRKIPAINVLYLSGIPKGELIPLEIFREKILKPIVKAIETRGIQDHVDYIAYSSGFPSQINCNADFGRLINAVRKKGGIVPVNKKMLRANVSINSATYFYQKLLNGDPTYISLNANRYYSKALSSVLGRPFDGEEQEQYQEAIRVIKRDEYEDAIEMFEKLAEKHPREVAVSYWLARAFGRAGDVKEVEFWLKRSIVNGWSFREMTKTDTAFAGMLENETFQEVLKLIPNKPPTYMPTRGFRNQYAWGYSGAIESKQPGEHYVISTVLAINRNKGNSERQALDQLLQTIGADGTRPEGKFYFTKTNDIRTKTRFNAFDDVIRELSELGYSSEIVKTRLPNKKKAVVGATIGTPSYNWERSGSKIMPGAICENLTSYGGVMHEDSSQTKLTALIRNGAAGSSGTVVEPFAMQAKFPHPRIHVHYVRGCTLGEAFYQSVQGPFQLLIVGDPLCSPWAEPAALNISSALPVGEPISGEAVFDMQPVKDSAKIARVGMYMDGVFIRRLNKSQLKLNTKSLSDGHHEMRIVSTAAGPLETRASVVVPFEVDNNGHKVTVSTKKDGYHSSNTIEFEVEAPCATELQMRHNWSILSKKKGVEKHVFKIPANQLGRGPVVVNGFAIIDGQYIQSAPLELEIGGKIRNTIPTVRSTWDPKPKPKPGLVQPKR